MWTCPAPARRPLARTPASRFVMVFPQEPAPDACAAGRCHGNRCLISRRRRGPGGAAAGWRFPVLKSDDIGVHKPGYHEAGASSSFLNFLLCIGRYSRLTMPQVDSEGTQPCIHACPFSPKLRSHSGSYTAPAESPALTGGPCWHSILNAAVGACPSTPPINPKFILSLWVSAL